MNRFSLPLKSLVISGILAVGAFAQPTPAPVDGDLLCTPVVNNSIVDTTAAARVDTVVSTADADGFYNLFDGKTFKGWWNNCRSSHSSSDRVNGAIWRIDTARKAIYSTQRGTSTGSLLSTKKRYLNYEVVFETWAGFGNDAGFFHRNTVTGQCYQTVLDYLNGASLGGTWGEGGFPSRDHRPFNYSNNDSTLSIPGTAGHNWTTFTAGRRAAGEDFPCGTTGCVQADWRTHWKLGSNPAVTDGWNTVRIRFYGGTSTSIPVRMRSWFKSKSDTATRLGTIKWIPIWSDSMNYSATQVASYGIPNPIAFQVHGGGRFGAARGTWYRNIRIRELDSTGAPMPVALSLPSGSGARVRYPDVKMTASALTGSIAQSHEITVSNLQGRLLRKFKGPAGAINYSLPSGTQALVIRIKTARGVEALRLNRYL